MNVGDLVKFKDPVIISDGIDISGIGTIVDIKDWADLGAPDRNVGTHVYVLWPAGDICLYEYDHDELEVVVYD